MDKPTSHEIRQLLNEYESEKESNITDQEPTIGRIVHYVTDESLEEHRPAIVVECAGTIASLQVFTAGLGSHGTKWKSSVQYDEEFKETGTWHWPEREDG